MSIADLRQSYEKGTLLEQDIKASPFEQFALWFNEALEQNVAEPTAVNLATADAQGRPSARVVLLKGFDDAGFVFYTNYHSRKAQDLAAQPWASLNFFWQPLERQVRINGLVGKVSAQESDDYFHSRPLGSRLGAWVSAQSQPTTLAELEANTAAVQQKFGDQPPRPPHWGGYRLTPEYFEFWQGRPSRLHDRLTFQRSGTGTGWALQRISP
jgi:pyridoxamine 5'-phosphate oxidase